MATKKTELIPVQDKVIIEYKEEEKTTFSGLIVPESKDQPVQGKVISVGPGWDGKSMQCKKGDIVFFEKSYAPKIEHDGKTYFVVRESELLAIIR